MSTFIESGHAKNVANFEDLISFCTGYGAAYNPVNTNIKIPALNSKLTAAQAALLTLKTSKTAFDNSTNTRESLFSSLKKLATRIVNALAATTASSLTLDDAKTVNRKIQGKRAGKVAEAPVVGATPSPEPTVTSISVSQQSFDSLIDNFNKLISVVSAEPLYLPNETDLKVPALNTLLASLKSSNTAVITAYTTYSTSRISRDTTLYAKDAGLVDLAFETKAYVKSLFGSSSPQYHLVSGIKFTRHKIS